jgi:hypothetical protein
MAKILLILVNLVTTIVSVFFPKLKNKINKEQIQQIEDTVEAVGEIVVKIKPESANAVQTINDAIDEVENVLEDNNVGQSAQK